MSFPVPPPEPPDLPLDPPELIPAPPPIETIPKIEEFCPSRPHVETTLVAPGSPPSPTTTPYFPEETEKRLSAELFAPDS